jgi:hypothetical protein
MVDPDLLTFDDLLPYPGFMLNGYGGLQWNGFGVIDGSVRDATSGYRTGLVSPDNVAFNVSGGPASISRDTPFTLKSAYLTEQVANWMQLRMSGWLGTTLVYDRGLVGRAEVEPGFAPGVLDANLPLGNLHSPTAAVCVAALPQPGKPVVLMRLGQPADNWRRGHGICLSPR